jgi:hypothetical protein
MVRRDYTLRQRMRDGTDEEDKQTRMYSWQKKRSRYCGVPSKLYREKNLLAAKEKQM